MPARTSKARKARSRLSTLTFTFAVLFLAVLVSGAAATPGALDPSFGRRGMVAEPYGLADDANSAALQRDGKIVTAGEAEISTGRYALISTRMLADGRLDTSYGKGGWVVEQIDGTGVGTSVAIQHNGDIVIGGLGRDKSTRTVTFAAIRLLPSGQLDPAFGDHGVALIPVGSAAIATSLAIQPDGKIVLGGAADTPYSRFAVARLNSDGSIDRTFGTNGVTTLGPYGAAWGLALQPDGKILLGGEAAPKSSLSLLGALLGMVSHNLLTGTEYMAARVLPDGKPDTTFGNAGKIEIPVGVKAIGTAIAATPQGEIIVAGSAFTHTVVGAAVELTPGGSLDPGFGSQGISEQPLEDPINAVAIQPNGDVLMAATGPTLIRLGPTGAPDPTFAQLGIDKIQQAAGDAANSVTIDQSDGDIILAGTERLSNRTEMSVVRLFGS